MVVGPMFLMEKLGPLSSVFFHFTVMRRSLPLASHGLVNEPTPLDFAGQSWCGSTSSGFALAEGTAEGVASGLAPAPALALAAGAWDFASSLEQPTTARAIANVADVRIKVTSDRYSTRPARRRLRFWGASRQVFVQSLTVETRRDTYKRIRKIVRARLGPEPHHRSGRSRGPCLDLLSLGCDDVEKRLSPSASRGGLRRAVCRRRYRLPAPERAPEVREVGVPEPVGDLLDGEAARFHVLESERAADVFDQRVE